MLRTQVLATLRVGNYIRTQIEPKIAEEGRGWESWLMTRRDVYDRQLNHAFAILFASYYLITAYVAATAPVEGDPYLNQFKTWLGGASGTSIEWLIAVVGFYFFVGVLAVLAFQILPARHLNSEAEKTQEGDAC